MVGDMLNGGAPGFKFDAMGKYIEGVVTEITERQDSVFMKPDQLKWWNRDDGPERGNPNDRPIMIPIFTLQTSLRDSDEDDGLRSIWARGHMFSAIRDAIKDAMRGRRDVSDADVVGGTLTVQHYALGKPPKGGGNPPKLYRAKFTPRAVSQVTESENPDPSDLVPTGEQAAPPPNW